MASWQQQLDRMDACDAALEWCADKSTLAEAWRDCQNGDWLLWLLGRSDLRTRRVPFVACIGEIVSQLTMHSTAISMAQRSALSDAMGLATMWAGGTVTPRELERACDPDRWDDADKEPLLCRILLEIGHLPYCGNPDEPRLWSDACHDTGSIIAMLVAQLLALEAPGRHEYPIARAQTLAKLADIVRAFFPAPPVVSGLEP